MKKPILVIPVIVVVALAATMVLGSKREATPTPAASTPSTPAAQTTTSDVKVAKPGVYADYSAEALVNATGKRLLFFHAPWCPQCRALDKSITDTTLPENITILKVDYDTNQELRKKYGVTLQTTIVVVDEAGSLIKKHVAYDTPTIQSVLEHTL